MKIKQSKSFKEAQEAQIPVTNIAAPSPTSAPAAANITQTVSQDPAQQAESVNLNYAKQFASQLKSLSSSFYGGFGSYENKEQALEVLGQIQTLVQKLIGSVDEGVRKNMITNTQAVNQAKNPYVQE